MATRYDLSRLREQLDPNAGLAADGNASKLGAQDKSQSSSTLSSSLHESTIKLDDGELAAMARETKLSIDLHNDSTSDFNVFPSARCGLQRTVQTEKTINSLISQSSVPQGGRHTVVEKFMTTMQAKDLIDDTGASNNDPAPSRMPRETRVNSYAEYQIPKQIGFSLATSAFGKGRRRSVSASDKTIKQRLLKLAQSTSRLTALVRRQRLGLQVLVDPGGSCRKPTRRAKCVRVCFWSPRSVVCAATASVATAPRNTSVLDSRAGVMRLKSRAWVCAYCVDRMDQAEYANLTSSSVLGSHILSDPIDSKPNSPSLKDLLEDALRTAPSLTRKTSVKSVIKYVLDQDTASQRRRGRNNSGLSSTSESPMLTLSSSDVDYVRALDSLELGDVVLRSDEHRCYQLDTSGTAVAVPTPIPENEDERLKAVCSMSGSELSTVRELEILCTLAAREMGCTTSVIALIQHDMYYGVASNVPELCNALVPRTQAMCAHTIMEAQAPLLVPHPEADIRFSKFDSVDLYGVRFYCAFPLMGEDDQVVGSMCCVNGESLEIRASQLAAFEKLASTASKVMRVETQQRRHKASGSSSTLP